MMRQKRIVLRLVLALLLLSGLGCSTQRNTRASRSYHALTTRYNVRFNGQESYQKGLRQMETAEKTDYSSLLPVYPISDHSLGTSASSQMSRCIEKCEKAIKEHSIRVKPDKKPARNASLKERMFYEQEEFNPVMGGVFLLMAKAQFHKADFESALATCSYIKRHFPLDKDLCDETSIWQARAYYESDWMYEAENILVRMNEEGFRPSLTGPYSLAYADFLIKRGQYAEAIPFLEIGLKNTSARREKQRYHFILGQLYQMEGENRKALNHYKAVSRLNPPYQMDLNARIRQTEVDDRGGNRRSLRKLRSMSRNHNNADYLDAIYYAMGNIYAAGGDTAAAVAYYRQAVEKSSKESPFKLRPLLAMGRYYYGREDFLMAAPCYEEAKSLVKEEHVDYGEIRFRAEMLDHLAPHLQTIHDQDSLQAVVLLPEDRRNGLIDSLIEVARQTAKEAARQQAREEALSRNREMAAARESVQPAAPTIAPVLGQEDNSWYFYNERAKTAGRREFERLWGRRAREDYWRLRNKSSLQTTASGGEEPAQASLQPAIQGDTALMEAASSSSFLVSDIDFEPSDDPTEVGYYLKDLPLTEEQWQESNDKIREALFQAGMVFRQEMRNDRLALKMFDELARRFPDDEQYLPEARYVSYLLLMQQGNTLAAEEQRRLLLDDFSASSQAELLSDPDYLSKLGKMYQVQDSLFAATYAHFLAGRSDSVIMNYDYLVSEYPYSNLRRNFMFLRALEAVKEGDGDLFYELMKALSESDTKSEGKEGENDPLLATAKGMTVLWDEGRRPVSFSDFYLRSGVTLADSLALAALDSIAERFEYHPEEVHYLALGYSPDSINANRLLFDVALYNFTNFLIRDYELSLEKIGGQEVLMIRSFENAEDVLRYVSWMTFQGQLPDVKYPGLQYIIVSESNYRKFEGQYPEEAYQRFFRKYYLQQ